MPDEPDQDHWRHPTRPSTACSYAVRRQSRTPDLLLLQPPAKPRPFWSLGGRMLRWCRNFSGARKVQLLIPELLRLPVRRKSCCFERYNRVVREG
jgi:hypothetical protein